MSPFINIYDYRYILLKLGVILLLLVTGTGMPQLTSAQIQDYAATDEASPGWLEEITVTARRRQEALQEVPVAITALSADAIRRSDIRSATDLQRQVPSLSVIGSPGRNEEALTIRGLRPTGEFLGAGAGPSVVSYFAEAPSRTGGPGLYLDLENVQVLKGPQGTLFGRNTTGGAILFEPVRPSSEFGGYARGTVGNYGRLDAEAAVNVSVISDKLMFRIAAQKQNRNGFTKDVYRDIDYDDRDNYSARIGIVFKPVEQLENYLIVWASEYDENGPGTVLSQNNPLGPFTLLQTPLFREQEARGIRRVALGSRSRDLNRTHGVLNRTEFDVNENISLTNIFSYTRQKGERAADLDGSVLTLTDSQGKTLPGTFHIDDSTITEELQLSVTGLDDAVDWLIGGYYERTETEGPQTFSQISVGAFGAFTTHQLDAPIETESYAVYSHLNVDLGLISDSMAGFNLSGGFRHTEDEYSLGFDILAYPGVLTVDQLPAPDTTHFCAFVPGSFYPNCLVSSGSEGDGQSWNVGLDYQITDDNLLYFSYRRGYKSGGYNPAIGIFFGTEIPEFAFGPEKVDTFELGAKSEWSVGGLAGHTNIALYLSKYNDVQVLNDVLIFGLVATTATQNAAEATIRGIEVEGTIRPVENIILSFGYAYTDAEYDEYITPAGADLSGLPFLNTPEHMINLGLTIEQELPGNLGEVGFLTMYSWQDDAFAGFVDAKEPGAIVDSYGLLNMRLEWSRILASRVSAAVFVNNVADKDYIVSNSPRYASLGRVISLYGEPRMWGVSLGIDF